MEFNVLPRARILSPKPSNKANQTTKQSQELSTNQTVNVILPQSAKDGDEPSVSISTCEPVSSAGCQGVKTRDVNLQDPAEKLNDADQISTINFLKLVLESYINNPVKFNEYIICSVPLLEQLIEVLTGCEDCDVDIGDFDTKCCGVSGKNIVPVTKIWVRNNDSAEIFKYKYSQFLQVFEEYHISLKFVYVEQ